MLISLLRDSSVAMRGDLRRQGGEAFSDRFVGLCCAGAEKQGDRMQSTLVTRSLASLTVRPFVARLFRDDSRLSGYSRFYFRRRTARSSPFSNRRRLGSNLFRRFHFANSFAQRLDN